MSNNLPLPRQDIETVPLMNYLERPEQKISNAYRLGTEMFQDYERFCTKKTNTHGETYYLGPEVGLWKTIEPVFDNETTKSKPKQVGTEEKFTVAMTRGYSGSSVEQVAKLQLAVREQKRKPAKNIHLDLIKDGNIQLPALQINANGRYVVDIEGDTIEFSYVDLIDELARISLDQVKAAKEKKKSDRRAALGWFVTLSMLGGAGYGGYEFFTREEKHEKTAREIFDENGYEIEGVKLTKGGEDMVIIEEFTSDTGLAFDSIPGYEDGESLAGPRRFNIEAGSCRDLGFLPDGMTTIIAKRPGTSSKIITTEDETGQFYVCAPDYMTRTSGQNKVVVTHQVAIQHITSTEQD